MKGYFFSLEGFIASVIILLTLAYFIGNVKVEGQNINAAGEMLFYYLKGLDEAGVLREKILERDKAGIKKLLAGYGLKNVSIEFEVNRTIKKKLLLCYAVFGNYSEFKPSIFCIYV